MIDVLDDTTFNWFTTDRKHHNCILANTDGSEESQRIIIPPGIGVNMNMCLPDSTLINKWKNGMMQDDEYIATLPAAP